MPDLYMTEAGDLAISANGDLAFTQTSWRDDVQQAYIRMMTDIGDFLIYPLLGANLSTLYGRPQSPETGQAGSDLIRSAMDRESRFIGKQYSVRAVPTGPQAVRFDVAITSGSTEQITVSVEQNLGLV